ncbi:MAG TPA: aminotransferase class V-fold PLP-dependent enzyme [Caldilineaceae bacterium]|mgnify:CR=1 FL=1|nr:aminotransferase class V-fold PLP-dependent enzyme [Caldilineaceae bacterium]
MATGTTASKDIYQDFGIKRVINAMGHVTLLGGSVLSPAVQAAMEAANQGFAPLEEVIDKTGSAIAGMVGTESAMVTSGCFAALVQGIAALITGNDPVAIGRLPDSSGMKNEILIQKRQRYHYDRCITVPGGRMVEVGDETGTTAAQLEAAIGPKTAGILHYARGEVMPGVLQLADVVAVAKRKGTRVIVDAASEIYPITRMHYVAQSGADLVCFGAKYLGAQNSAGILCGDADLVRVAKLHSFIGYEAQRSRGMGRGFKLDRQEVIGVTVALREWLAMDHEERIQQQVDRIAIITDRLADLPHIQTEEAWNPEREAWIQLQLTVNGADDTKLDAICQELRNGEPSIWLRPTFEGGKIAVMVNTLQEGETEIVAQRLHEVLSR